MICVRLCIWPKIWWVKIFRIRLCLKCVSKALQEECPCFNLPQQYIAKTILCIYLNVMVICLARTYMQTSKKGFYIIKQLLNNKLNPYHSNKFNVSNFQLSLIFQILNQIIDRHIHCHQLCIHKFARFSVPTEKYDVPQDRPNTCNPRHRVQFPLARRFLASKLKGGWKNSITHEDARYSLSKKRSVDDFTFYTTPR